MFSNLTDLINGLFEFIGAVALFFNVLRLRRDKHIKGIHWGSTAFFTSWGCWNAIFYPMNGLWLSFAGGLTIVFVNFIWLGHLFYYTRIKKTA